MQLFSLETVNPVLNKMNSSWYYVLSEKNYISNVNTCIALNGCHICIIFTRFYEKLSLCMKRNLHLETLLQNIFCVAFGFTQLYTKRIPRTFPITTCKWLRIFCNGVQTLQNKARFQILWVALETKDSFLFTSL